jgi:hypothetical protein
MRPFEKGDLVITTDSKIGKVMLVKTEWAKDKGWREFEKPLIVMFEHGTQHCTIEYIKHIRKPRPGGKEARDIVAMLGSQARIAKNLQARELGWSFLKNFTANGGIKNYGVVIFQKAKSMLVQS